MIHIENRTMRTTKVRIFNSSTYILPGIKILNYTPHGVIMDVAKYFDITSDQLKQKCRERRFTTPRYIAMYLIDHFFKNKYSQAGIGYLCGGFDHATVIHAFNTVRDLMDIEPAFRGKVLTIMKTIEDKAYSFESIK